MPYNDVFKIPRTKESPSDTTATFDSESKTIINRKGILSNVYNPNSDYNLRNTYTHENIITNTFDDNHRNDVNTDTGFASTTSSSRPSHKTHVEIITKNGATKKPNIIGSNYNPDGILTNQNFHHNNIYQQAHVRNDIVQDNFQKSSYDRKITCMLYLQADHTFFQKMGSDDASIEAITRHVQRANVIYKNTGN